MVAPIGIQDTEFRLCGIAAFLAEVEHHFAQVVGIHGQTPVPAESGEILFLHLGEAIQLRQRTDRGRFQAGDDRQVLLPALHGVDEIAADNIESFPGKVVVEDQQAAAADVHLGRRVEQVDAVEGRRCPLVELAGNVFHGQVTAALQVEGVGHRIGDTFAEDRVAAALQQVIAESRQVVKIDQPEAADVHRQVFIEFFPEAFGLHPESGFLLDKDTAAFHQRRWLNLGFEHFLGLCLAEGCEAGSQHFVVQRQHSHGIERRVLCPVDGHRGHGNA